MSERLGHDHRSDSQGSVGINFGAMTIAGTQNRAKRNMFSLLLFFFRWNHGHCFFWGASKSRVSHHGPTDSERRSWSGQLTSLRESSSPPWCREGWYDDASFSVQTAKCENTLSSPRLWLENHPDGVYTVLRVEWADTVEAAQVWGLDFHMDRLEHSFRKAYPKSNDAVDFENARTKTLSILQELLQEAKVARISNYDERELFMATFLWVQSKKMGLNIKGHLLRRLLSDPAPPATPLVGTLAPTVTPNRYDSGLADCKLSSWCSARRPLEDEFRDSKDPNPQEVILTIPRHGGLNLLEGLTSNLFVLYPGGVVRTALTSHVLPGFARTMTIACLEEAGYLVDTESPISIEDAPLWKQVFVTSAIQLVVPVRQIRYHGASIWELDAETSETDLSSLLRATILEQCKRWKQELAVNRR